MFAFDQFGERSVFIDGIVEDHGLHRKRERVLQFARGLRHDDLQLFLRLFFSLGRDNETHAAARHAAQHPESPEVLTKRLRGFLNELFRVEVCCPGNDCLNRAAKVSSGHFAQRLDVAFSECRQNIFQNPECLLAATPLAGGSQQVFFSHHF